MQSIPEYNAPKLRQIVAEAVFRRKRLVITTVACVCSLALLAILAMHRKYEARAKLLVQNVRTASQLTTSSVDHLVSQGDVSQAEINTEVDLLESDGVARLALGQGDQATAQSKAQNRAVQRFKDQLSVEAVHQTDVIDLKMLGDSAEHAQLNLQHVIDAYFEERAGTARSSGAAGFFQRQLEEKNRQLDADQAGLTAFEMQHGIADLDDQTKLQVTRLSALQDQLFTVEAGLSAAEKRASTEAHELAATPARSQTQIRSITNQYSQERLTTSMVDLQNRRIELLKRYVPTDRQILEVDEKISTTQRAIHEAAEHPAAEEATDVNPVWAQLSTLVATSGSEISGLQGQQGALQEQIEAAHARLNELEQSAASYGDLRRKLQQSQADYALYAQRRDEARISEALDRQKLFDVAVTQAPIASMEAVRPKPLLYMTSALAFGLLFAMALAVYGDMASAQVYTPAQLDSWTGQRTWATFANEAEAPYAHEANKRQFRRVLFATRQAVLQAPRTSVPKSAKDSYADDQRVVLPPLAVGGDHAGLCVAITSALPGEGVSFTVNRLAQVAAEQSSNRVAVIDTRALLKSFEPDTELRLPMRLEQGAEHWVLASETSSPSRERTARANERGAFSVRLRSVLQQMREDFDLVLLDCPSLQVSTLAGELASCIDGYLVVVRAGTARKQNIEDMAAQLNSTAVPVLGHMLNCRNYPVPRWLHRII